MIIIIITIVIVMPAPAGREDGRRRGHGDQLALRADPGTPYYTMLCYTMLYCFILTIV